MFSGRIAFILTFFSFCCGSVMGQDKPIGSWESYLPYNSALGVATDGNTLFTANQQSFFTYESSSGQLDPFSKVEGMSDIGMQAVGYDAATNTAILVYANSNIDLYKDNTFYNIPDIKIKAIAGDKTVFNVYTLNGMAYLSTSLGVVVIDLSKKSIKETYQFVSNSQTVPVKGFTDDGHYFYAVTTQGVYRVDHNNPQIQNYQVWDIVDPTTIYNNIVYVNGQIFLSSLHTVVKLTGTTVTPFYSSFSSINHIDAGFTDLLISEYHDSVFTGVVQIMRTDSSRIDSFNFVGKPHQAVQLADSSIWLADEFGGLMKRDNVNKAAYYTPAGPTDPIAFNMYVKDGNLWIVHGGYNEKIEGRGNRSGMSNLVDGKWHYYNRGTYAPFDTLQDFVDITKDETDGTIYAGSYYNGLFILKADGGYQQVCDGSIFDPSQLLGALPGRVIGGLALDGNRNLWMTSIYAAHVLYVKTADSQWYKFLLPGITVGGPVVVDDNGQIWFATLQPATNAKEGGLTVYNHGGTISDQSDDAYYHMTTGVGFGNLPSNKVLCLAKDKNNNIWIGTSDGIGIVNSCHPEQGQASVCDAEVPIVQYDKFPGYLFKGNGVRTIAVDGANRKWIGTDNGVWLLSSDASKIIYRFTVDNSPLPSNQIEKIAVDPVTGQVYIGTTQGMVSFRSTATDGGTTNDRVVTFPNPVPSGYGGTIAIKGLVANGDVRITDISGQLVYRTKALGGQAIWNGLDYTGHRPQSGVYLIFVSSADGNEKYTGKMVFLK